MQQIKTQSVFNWRPFYEARFGVEVFVERYDSTLSSPVSSYLLERYITSYFIAFTVVVYCYYGYSVPAYFVTFDFNL